MQKYYTQKEAGKLFKQLIRARFDYDKDAAEHYHVHKSYISNVCKGISPPNSEMLIDLSFDKGQKVFTKIRHKSCDVKE